MSRQILVVEDDINIAQLLRMYLEKDGFTVEIAGDGGQGLQMFRQNDPLLVLLDLMLPVRDGWSVCREIRQESKTPIIMITAKGETIDRVQGLEMGADDYIVKPFDMKEVMARIHAVLRRTDQGNNIRPRKLSFDKLVINMDSFTLTVDGKEVDGLKFTEKSSVSVEMLLLGQ